MIIRFRTNAIIDDVFYSTINDLNSLLVITDLPIIFYFANYLSHVVKKHIPIQTNNLWRNKMGRIDMHHNKFCVRLLMKFYRLKEYR
jgi:hypothetical protein